MIYDKRKLKRYNIFLIVEFKPLKSPGGYSIGITRDLSPEGFSLEAQTIDCQRGDTMEFRLKHPDAERSVTISGEVIWKNHSWYKYAIGIKFLKVDEEQNTEILKLMSAVRDEADKPELRGKDSAGSEKEKEPAVISEAVAIDNSHPETCMTNNAHISLKGSDTEDEKIFTANVDTGFGQNMAQTIFDNSDTEGNHQKKSGWLYVPFAAIAVIIFVIAVPVIFKKLNNTQINPQPELTESADYRYVEKDGDVFTANNIETSGQGLNELSVTSPVQQTAENPVEKPGSAANTKAFRDDAERNPKIDLISNIDETLKTYHAIQNERPSEGGAIAETEKTTFVKSEKAPVTEATNIAGITNPDLLKKWEPVGSTQSGVPLFIAPDNISRPYDDVVNLLVKASVNKKDFIDLVAINCPQIKLRILEERNGANPVLSEYSDEWRDVTPDSMILYNSVCPEKK